MRRRDLFLLLTGAVASWPILGAAEQPKMPIIGFLAGVSPELERFWRGFKDAMQERGYVEGQNVRYEFRSAQQATQLPEFAAELVRLNVDVIVTRFTPATLAAKQATRDIPIVMAFAGDPVENGLVESLARPGGNVTGVSGIAAELSAKAVELIRELLPSARRIVVLANAADPFSKPLAEKIRAAGDASGIAVTPMMIRGAELDAAFAVIEKDRFDAMFVQGSLPTKRAAALALQDRIPSVMRPEEGGLMAYRGVEAEIYRRAAVFVDKVLKGAKPADLPVEQPTRFELVINLKTAKALGLTIPPALLERADEVIE